MRKVCTRCKIEKDISEFCKDKRRKDGLNCRCKICKEKYRSSWNKLHRKNLNECARKYRKVWIKNPKNKLDSNMKRLIRDALKGKKAGQSWKKLVGYTVEDLMEHLEKQFDDKMNWGNHGKYWHIHHRKPKSLFKYKTAEDPEFKECWALENLQPLEAKENLKKGNKYSFVIK